MKAPGPPGLQRASVVPGHSAWPRAPKRSTRHRWKAQVRLCQRDRPLMANGNQPHQVVVARARALSAFRWAMAQPGAVPPTAARQVVASPRRSA